jgi:signal transduction histidine kinase
MDGGRLRLRRQYLAIASAFAALLLISFVVFGRLIIDQLSRSYLEDVLLSGRAHATDLAKQISGQGPLYKVVEQRRETLQKISAALTHQDIVESIQVLDEMGRIVYETTTRSRGYVGGFPEGNAELLLPGIPKEVVEEAPREYTIQVPLEDLGSVVLTLSQPVLAERIALLRRRLLINTTAAGGLAFAVLAAAVGFIWHLVQRNARLEERRRLDEELASLGTLAANLAHEIRNPLNALSLNLEMLQEDMSRADLESETARLARHEVNRLSQLVNDFLVYARPRPPIVEECIAAVLLDEVGRLLQPVADRAGVSLRVAAAPLAMRVDRGQITQVVVNLALNAIQSMEGAARRELVLGAHAEDLQVVLEVTDSGPGIPESELGRVREAFYSTRRGGTGLGLAIADRAVAGHGGSLELINGVGGGLIARVTLPTAPPTTV